MQKTFFSFIIYSHSHTRHFKGMMCLCVKWFNVFIHGMQANVWCCEILKNEMKWNSYENHPNCMANADDLANWKWLLKILWLNSIRTLLLTSPPLQKFRLFKCSGKIFFAFDFDFLAKWNFIYLQSGIERKLHGKSFIQTHTIRSICTHKYNCSQIPCREIEMFGVHFRMTFRWMARSWHKNNPC